MAKRSATVKQTAEDLGVTAKWIRAQIAEGTVSPRREGSKRNGRFLLSNKEVEILRSKATERSTTAAHALAAPESLARISQLEADRSNLLAQVAWARAIAHEQSKTLEVERERADRLAAEVETQRARVEALKAMGVVDRALGRHKAI